MSMFLNIFNHKLFKNTFIYTFSSAIRTAIPFFLLPILTRYLTPYDYGIVATFQVLLAMMIVFVGLSTHGAITVNFFNIEKQKLKVYIGNVFFILFISFILTLGTVYILKGPLSNLMKFPEEWLPIIVVVALSQSIITLTVTLWRVEQKPIPFGLFLILQSSLNVILSLVFVIMLNWEWQGRILGVTIASIVFAIISIFIIYKRKYINLSYNKNFIKDAMKFGIPLIPHALSKWIMTGTSRIFINSMVSVSSTGIYTVGYQVGFIISLLATSFNQAWLPFLFEKLKKNNYSTKVKIVKLTYLYNISVIILALGISVISPIFLKFFVGESFQSAYKFVFWIALGFAAEGMYLMVVNYILYVKKTYILAWVTFFTASINILLNYLLIKSNGAIGAAQATTIAYFLKFIVVWLLSAKVYKMPWRLHNLRTV